MSSATVVVARVRHGRRRLAGSRLVVIGCTLVLSLAVFLALFGPLIAPHDPNAADLNQAFVGPSEGHPLGFDGQGRDLFSRLVTGARTSLIAPLLVVAIALSIGGGLAIAAAWTGGRVDAAISTFIDILFSFPGILLAILAAAVFGPGIVAPTLALGIAYTPYVARILRSAALRERAQEYIAACEVQGLSAVVICARHLVPNLLPLIVAQATLMFGYAVVDFAAISYLGLGVQPPAADWGVMVATGQSGVLQGYPAESLAAGLCVVAVVVALNILGERISSADQEGR